MSGLTKEKQNELQEAFTMNCGGDGKVPLKALGTVIRSVGVSPTEAQLQAICKDFENKGVRSLDFQQVLGVVSKNDFKPETIDSLRDAFRIFDKDGNGYVNAAELRHVLCNLGEKLSEEEVDEMIREADLTGDGQVNYEEFVKVLKQGC